MDQRRRNTSNDKHAHHPWVNTKLNSLNIRPVRTTTFNSYNYLLQANPNLKVEKSYCEDFGWRSTEDRKQVGGWHGIIRRRWTAFICRQVKRWSQHIRRYNYSEWVVSCSTTQPERIRLLVSLSLLLFFFFICILVFRIGDRTSKNPIYDFHANGKALIFRPPIPKSPMRQISHLTFRPKWKLCLRRFAAQPLIFLQYNQR